MSAAVSKSDANSGNDWWRGASIYQIYPRSFQDTNGDGVGDLPGITQRLGYLADLGVDAIWLSPFFTSPMKDFGYDVANYRDVDPLFGTLADFDQLVERAHQLGLKVLIDQVLSHTSSQHPWFVESRSSRQNERADWYVWCDANADGTPPNNWQSVFGGPAWTWDTRRRQYYLHNFLAAQPDLNYYHEHVQVAILDEVRFWLERGVDGFRFDACNFHFHDRQFRNNPPLSPGDPELTSIRTSNPYGFQLHKYDKSRPENLRFLKRLRKLLNQYDVVGLGEIGDDDSLNIMAQYTAGGDKLHMAYSFNLLTDEFSAARIRAVVGGLEERIQSTGGWGCWSLSNHDCERVMTRWSRGEFDPAMAKVLLGVLGSLRGSFCIYQGEELGLTESNVPYELLQDPSGITFWPDYKGRDGCRTPIPWASGAAYAGFSEVEPWLPVESGHVPQAVDVQQAEPDSVLHFYRQFLVWRRAQKALRQGALRFHAAPEPLLIIERELEGERLLAVFNLGTLPAQLELPCPVTPLAGHGLRGARVKGLKLSLPAWGGFFGRVV